MASCMLKCGILNLLVRIMEYCFKILGIIVGLLQYPYMYLLNDSLGSATSFSVGASWAVNFVTPQKSNSYFRSFINKGVQAFVQVTKFPNFFLNCPAYVSRWCCFGCWVLSILVTVCANYKQCGRRAFLFRRVLYYTWS
jgi:hypothetical protein